MMRLKSSSRWGAKPDSPRYQLTSGPRVALWALIYTPHTSNDHVAFPTICHQALRSNRAAQLCRLPRRGTLHCRAISLPDSIDATVRNVISISSVVGISYAILLAAVSAPPSPPPPALPPSPAARQGQRAFGPTGGVSRSPGTATGRDSGASDDDNFVWGLMGFISFLPLFNWLAWVLAAISDEDRAVLYGIYAALYGTPLLLRGLDWQDPWCLFMVALCVVHVQAERISQTEPETLRSIRPVGAIGALLQGVLGGTGAFLSGLGGVLAEDSKRAVRRPGSSNARPPAELGSGDDRLQLGHDPDLVVRSGSPRLDPRRDISRDPDLEDPATRELRQFDEQLRMAEQQKMKTNERERGDDGGGSSGGAAR